MRAWRKLPTVKARIIEPDPALTDTSALTVDVVVPCFNYADYVGDAIASALSQREVSVRVIVVDDASTDESAAVVRAIAAGDPRVELVEHATNQGPVATFNDGLDRVTGDYVVRLDADDLLTPGSLARAVALAEHFPSVGLVYGHPIHFTHTRPTPRERTTAWTVWSGDSWLELRCRLGVNCITSPEVLMRTSVVRQVGGQKDLAHTHDMEMWMRIARHADVAHLAGCDQAWHREHAASLSAREVDVLEDLRERSAAFRVLFGSNDDSRSDALWALARQALADEAATRAISAYLKGRGAARETQQYLRFAQDLSPDRGASSRVVLAERALRGDLLLGRASPMLVWHAARFRITRDILGRFWKSTGL